MPRSTSPIRVGPDLEARFAGADRLSTECVVNLLRTNSLVTAELERRFRDFGLSLATFNVLMILEGATGPLCPYEIGERLLVTRGTVTGLLDSLEKRGLIQRRPHPDDRRMLQIEATDEARQLLRDLLPDHFAAEARMMTELSPRERETLIRLLGKVQGAFTQAPAGA